MNITLPTYRMKYLLLYIWRMDYAINLFSGKCLRMSLKSFICLMFRRTYYAGLVSCFFWPVLSLAFSDIKALFQKFHMRLPPPLEFMVLHWRKRRTKESEQELLKAHMKGIGAKCHNNQKKSNNSININFGLNHRLLKHLKTKKLIKTIKKLNFVWNKKSSRGIESRNICTEFCFIWNIFRHRNDETYSVTHQKVASPTHKPEKLNNSKNLHLSLNGCLMK